jgi:hypothetical protein
MNHYPDCKLIDVPQRSDEWFAARKGHLTASQFGDWLTDYAPKMALTIEEIKNELCEIGISFPAKGKKEDYVALLPNPDSYKDLSASYKSARLTAASQCLAELAGYPDPPPYETDDMRRGVELEPLARDAFQKHTGLTVDEIGFAKSRHGYFGCSPDGLILSTGAGLEIKCPRPSKLIQYIVNNELPEEYRAQVHGSMAVLGCKSYHFFAFHPAFPFFHIEVRRDVYTEEIAEGLKSYSNYFAALASQMQELKERQETP